MKASKIVSPLSPDAFFITSRNANSFNFQERQKLKYMNTIEFLLDWLAEHPAISNTIKYFIWLILIVAAIQLIRKLLRKRLKDSSIRYRAQKGIEIFGYFLLIILTISYFTGNIQDFTLLLGLFTAGIAFTLQELLLSIAGSIYIFLVRVYQPGDRIEINGIKGDVIDIDSIYTTIMEIGKWVSSDNYSGRIIKLSNAFVFKGPIYNYSQDFPFIWDEFSLPIRYGSDVEVAKSIIIEAATEILTDYTAESKSTWKEIVSKYYIENAQLDPSLAITMTDNWMQFNLRYIVDFRKRRLTQHRLQEWIRTEIKKTNGLVRLASSTLEIIDIPEVVISSSAKNG